MVLPTFANTDPIAPFEDLLNSITGAGNTDIGALDTRIDAIEAGSSRGTGAHFLTSSLSTLNTLASAVGTQNGDTAVVTTASTGITRHIWLRVLGGGTYMEPVGPIFAATKANMDSYISAVAAQANIGFRAGGIWFDGTTGITYRFTSVAGAYTADGSVIIPTSVTTATESNGIVSFTTASSFSINGCFSSAFTDYMVYLDIVSTSTSAGGTVRLRNAGADSSTGVYGYQQTLSSSSSVSTTTLPTATAWNFTGAAGTEHYSIIKLNAPAATRATRGQIETGTWTANVPTSTSSKIRHSPTTTFDSITFIASAGNFTGTARVVGVR